MGVQENIAATQSGYEAFGSGDVDALRALMADDIEWVVRGDSSLSGTKRGPDETFAYFAQLGEKGLTASPKRFIGDGDTVVIFVDGAADGETWSGVDVCEYNDQGKLVRFEGFGEEQAIKRIFG